jgi:hypothetical protein
LNANEPLSAAEAMAELLNIAAERDALAAFKAAAVPVLVELVRVWELDPIPFGRPNANELNAVACRARALVKEGGAL